MYKLLLCCALLVQLGGALFAQQPAKMPVLDAFMYQAVSHIDKSGVKTGILLDQAPVFVNPHQFDGSTPSKSNCINASQFGRLYGQFRSAGIKENPLPHPDIYLSDLLRLGSHADTIPLALMAMQYDYIRKDALEKKLLYLNTEGRVIDVDRRAQSPFAQDTTFAFAALVSNSNDKRVVFRLPSKLIFENLGWSFTDLQVNLGDSRGWIDIRPNECLTASYPSTGVKPICLRWIQNGKAWYGHSSIAVGEKPVLERYSEEPELVEGFSGASLQIFYSCPDKKLRKPLIIVEGFGGDFTDYNDMKNLIDNPGTSGTPSLWNFLDEEDYDLVWVDWTNSNAAIGSNAAALQQVIQYVNNIRHANGSTHKINLIGNSMGGLVAKYCLLDMHVNQGLDAEVERFFSYDSPLTGANFPVGLQCFIRDILSLSGATQADPSLAGAMALLDGEAATQMLRQKVSLVNGTLMASSAGLDMLLAKIAAMEAQQPLTGITRHIALSNGSFLPQQNVTNPLILELILNLDSFEGAPGGAFYDIKITFSAFAANTTATLLYNRIIEVIPLGINQASFVHDSLSYVHPTVLALDVAPGGLSNLGLGEIVAALNSINVPNQSSAPEVNMAMQNYCFIPTVSSLGQPTGFGVMSLFPALGATPNIVSISTDMSVVSQITNMAEFNQDHVSMNPRIADIFKTELKVAPLGELGTTLPEGQIFNFGQKRDNAVQGGYISTAKSIDYNLDIYNGGELWINRNARLAYVADASNPENDNTQLFSVIVPGNACEGGNSVVITTQNGGKILVGDSKVQNRGELILASESQLNINSGDGLVLDNASKLLLLASAQLNLGSQGQIIMQEGSTLVADGKSVVHLYAGSVLRLKDQAALEIKSEAKLIIEPGAVIILEGPNSKVLIDGRLVINGNFEFSGAGYWEFTKSNVLELGPDASAFRLRGMNMGSKMIRLYESTLSIPEDKGLILENGAVEYVGNAGGFYLADRAWVNCTKVAFQGTGGNGIEGVNAGDVKLQDCIFDNFSSPLYLWRNDQHASGVVTAKSCEFENISYSIFISQRFRVEFESCKINTHNSIASAAITSLQNFALIIRNSHLQGVPQGVSANIDPLIDVGAYNCGIEAAGGWLVWMDGGTIQGFDAGIRNVNYYVDEPVNIYMNHWATISDCDFGIVMDGNETTGLVTMECARIMNAQTCIKGNDIKLMIDPQQTAQPSGVPKLRPNVFVVYEGGPSGLYLDICYTPNLGPKAVILAKYNYWGKVFGNGVNYTIPSPADFLVTHNNCQLAMGVNTTGALTTERADCADELTGDIDDCSTAVGRDETVQSVFVDGLNEIQQANFEVSMSKFSSISSLANTQYFENYALSCRTTILAARSLANGTQPDYRAPESDEYGGWANWDVYPNPASDNFAVRCSDSDATVCVRDGLGRLMASKKTAGGFAGFDTASWPRGVYWVTLKGVNINQTKRLNLH